MFLWDWRLTLSLLSQIMTPWKISLNILLEVEWGHLFTVFKELVQSWICSTAFWSTRVEFLIDCSMSTSPTIIRDSRLRLWFRLIHFWALRREEEEGVELDFMFIGDFNHYWIWFDQLYTLIKIVQSLTKLRKAFSQAGRSLTGNPISHFTKWSQNLTTRHSPSTSMSSNRVQNYFKYFISFSP